MNLQSFTTFIGAANTSILHPLDRERFRAFVIDAHTKNANIYVDELRESLEKAGFDPEDAVSLAEKYEFGRALLQDFTN